MGVGGGGGALEKFSVCTKAGPVAWGQATQPPGVHCLDYLSMNIEMCDRQEASCSKTRQVCMPHGQADSLRCSMWMLY